MLHLQPTADPHSDEEWEGSTEARDGMAPLLRPRMDEGREYTERDRRLTLLLATWFPLWDILAGHVRNPSGAVDHRSGRPFTAAVGTTVANNTAADDGTLWIDTKGLSPSQTALLRRAAAVWGGQYYAREGRLSGCSLGLTQ